MQSQATDNVMCLLCRVDATAETGFKIRLCNHWAHEPNSVMYLVRDDYEFFPCLFAKRDMKAGEEIVYNYGFNVPFKV